MEQSRGTIAFVTVLVVTPALVYRGGDPPAPAPGVSEETATPDTAIPTTPACALAQLLARSVPDIRSAPPAETRDPGDCGLRQWSAESLDVIVALVPAPFGSNGSWRFDGMLSASVANSHGCATRRSASAPSSGGIPNVPSTPIVMPHWSRPPLACGGSDAPRHSR